MTDFLTKYGYTPNQEAMSRALELIAANLENVASEQVYKDCFSMMDLTTLKTDDTPASVTRLVDKVNAFQETYPEWPLPASVCVYPNFASTVKEARACDFNITVVSACFPSSQSFLEVKLKECEIAVEQGADEVDIVLNVGKMLTGDYDEAANEVEMIRSEMDEDVVLKVILETGALKTPELIRKASLISMAAGADFIKTSTGKIDVAATPEAAVVMCQAIKDFYDKTGIMVGFKSAGCVKSPQDAALYYTIVEQILGEQWLTTDLFRIGASSAANNLLSAIVGKTVSHF
mgnify:CR=1 FL=1